MKDRRGELWLVRHGETEWSLTGQHTGCTDIPLTEGGREQARKLEAVLADNQYGSVLCSPLRRAKETAALAGFSNPQLEPNLMEMAYGDFEGLTAFQIRQTHPDWTIWSGVTPGGETLEQVAERAVKALELCKETTENGLPVLFFAHGHFLRILATQWLKIEPQNGAFFALDPASVSVLGYEHGRHVLQSWNQTY